DAEPGQPQARAQDPNRQALAPSPAAPRELRGLMTGARRGLGSWLRGKGWGWASWIATLGTVVLFGLVFLDRARENRSRARAARARSRDPKQWQRLKALSQRASAPEGHRLSWAEV